VHEEEKMAYISPVTGIFDATINSCNRLANIDFENDTSSEVRRECFARVSSLFFACFCAVSTVIFALPECVLLNIQLLKGRPFFCMTTLKANFLFFKVVVLGLCTLILGTLSPPTIYNWCDAYGAYKRTVASFLCQLPANFNEISEKLDLDLNQFPRVSQALGNWRGDLAQYLAESEIIECRHMLARHMSFSSMDYNIFREATRRLLRNTFDENLVNVHLLQVNLQTGVTDSASCKLVSDRLASYWHAIRSIVAPPDQTYCFYNVVFLAMRDVFHTLQQEGFHREDLVAYSGQELEAIHGRMMLSLIDHCHIVRRRVEIRFPEARVSFDASHNLLNLYDTFRNLKEDSNHLTPHERALLIRALNHRGQDDGALLHGRAASMFQRIQALTHQNIIDHDVLMPMIDAYNGQFDYLRRILTEAEPHAPPPRGPLVE
jgi:hypothetical protein